MAESSAHPKRMRNFPLKLLAFAMACVTWFLIRDAISFQVVVKDLPIAVQAPRGMAIERLSHDRVSITFRGSQADIRALDRNSIYVQFHVEENREVGEHEVRLTAQQVDGIQGAKIIQFEPEVITLELDREGMKEVPVTCRTVGTPLIGEVESITCDPVSVRLWGPQKRLAEIQLVRTEPIDMDGRVQSFTRRVRIALPSDSWDARVEPREVEASVVLVERAAVKPIADVHVAALVRAGDKYTVEIAPEKVSVVLRGKAEHLEGLDRNSLTAYVDCSDVTTAGTLDMLVRLDLPSGIDSAVVDPQTVRVVVNEL